MSGAARAYACVSSLVCRGTGPWSTERDKGWILSYSREPRGPKTNRTRATSSTDRGEDKKESVTVDRSWWLMHEEFTYLHTSIVLLLVWKSFSLLLYFTIIFAFDDVVSMNVFVFRMEALNTITCISIGSSSWHYSPTISLVFVFCRCCFDNTYQLFVSHWQDPGSCLKGLHPQMSQ